MKLRLALSTIVASCLLINAMTKICIAQRHPSRTASHSEVPPLPPAIRLVQGTEDDLDDMFETTRDLLEELDTEDTGSSDLDLDALTTPPQSDPGAAQVPKLPRTLDEYQPLDDLQRLTEDDGLDLDSLTKDEGSELDASSRYQDVLPRTAADRSRRRQANIPHTLGSILGDDDDINPCCEQEFCRRIWACAGGRNQDWCERMKRKWRRDRLLRGGNSAFMPGDFSEPFVCPVCQQAEYGGGYPLESNYPGQIHESGPYDSAVMRPGTETEIIIERDYEPADENSTPLSPQRRPASDSR